MTHPPIPTPAQTFELFRICYQLTSLYLDIAVVRLDERTLNLFILAGEDLIVTIEPDGNVEYPS